MILYSVCEYSRKERYAVLFVGNVGNPFPTNSVNSYIRNSALMGISGILYIFVGMWECGSIKKYFKQIYVFVKTFCKKIPTFPQPLLCMENPTEIRQEYENTEW